MNLLGKPRLVFLSVVLFASGCATVHEKESPYSGLWAGPGTRSKETLREVLPFYAPDGVATAYWTDAQGRNINAREVIDSITKYLVKIGLFAKWPNGGMGYDDVDSRCIAPYHFFIISIRPTVVVMASRLASDPIYGAPGGPNRGNSATTTKYFENNLEYGATFVDRPEILWFSPDLDVEPTPVALDRNRSALRIEHPQVVIRAKLESDLWTTERLK